MKEPIVDREKCTGCGVCEALCPRVFRMDESGKAVVEISGVDTRKRWHDVQECIEMCPVKAISWGKEKK